MMYKDEEIINKINDEKLNRKKDITSKVIIKNEEYVFENREVLDGLVVIKVPTSFEYLKEEYVKIKYPNENRPNVILSDEEGTVNITFNILNYKVNNDQLEEINKGIIESLKRVNTNISFYDFHVEQTKNLKIVYYDFKSPTYDADLYNINFSTVVNERLFMGTFNCNLKDVTEWKKVAIQMILSMKDLSVKE